LTGLITREAFTAYASRLMRKGPLAVLVIDLDGFKDLNDRHGHAAGDAALSQIAGRLRMSVRARRGFVARLGGDEFAAVLCPPTSHRLPMVLAEIYAWLCEPIEFEGRLLPVGASVGGFWTGDLPVPELSRALRRADEAMYEAKRHGGGWLIADGPARICDTVTGRRAGRNGTHLNDTCDDGGEWL
jgi:diguanylate cyclase (GGDEF)-like protein